MKSSENLDSRMPRNNPPEMVIPAIIKVSRIMDFCQMPFPRPRMVIKSKLFLSAADQKGIGVKQKDQGEYRHHAKSHAEKYLDRVSAPDGRKGGGSAQKRNNVAHHHRSYAGQNIGDIQFSVIFDACHASLR